MKNLSRLAAALLALAPGAALAHEQAGVAGGLVSGFVHPILGLDHLVAMVAVGLWGAQLGRPLLIALPITFPAMMAVGALLGILGAPVPSVEFGIALSAVALGLIVVAAWKAPAWAAVAVVAVFALFHGFAHGTELPEAANPLAYGVGFIVSTGLLHAAGIGLGALAALRPEGPMALRGCGAVVAAVGMTFLAPLLGLTA